MLFPRSFLVEMFSGSDPVDQGRQTTTAEPEFSSPGEDEEKPCHKGCLSLMEEKQNPMALLFTFILMGVFCAFWIPSQVPGLVKHGGLDGNLLNSPKGIWFMTGLLLSSKIQGNLNFIQGRGNLSPNMFFPGQLCFPPPTSSKQNDLLWNADFMGNLVIDCSRGCFVRMFLYELGVGSKQWQPGQLINDLISVTVV